MAQSLSQVVIHIIFSTKDREPYLTENIRCKTHAYIASIIRNMDGNAFRVGGVADHIHIAASLPRTISQSDLLQNIKKDSSKWIRTQGIHNFSWQKGYGNFSISYSHLDNLLQYIDNQLEHHKTKSFQEEYREFLGKYNIKYDETYVWD